MINTVGDAIVMNILVVAGLIPNGIGWAGPIFGALYWLMRGVRTYPRRK